MIWICIKVCDLQTHQRRELLLQINPTSCFYVDRMDINTFVYLSVLCMWCSLHAGRSPLIVAARSQPNQPTLSAEILTPEAERKEGGQVEMNCTSSFDLQHFTLEWLKDNITLKQDEGTVTSDPRFGFVTGFEMNGMLNTEQLIITGVHRDDSGIYTCNVNDTRGAQGTNIAASVHVTLSVLYFPSESFPICSPAGPITAVAGTELNLQCSSEVGNPQVMMEIYRTKYNDTFTLSHHGDMISMSLALIAHVDYNTVQFLCTIASPMYYPNISTCIIGPINVSSVTGPPTGDLTSPTYPSHNKTTAGPIVAGAVTGVVVLIVIIVLIIVCRRRHGLCKMKQSSEDNTSIKIPTTTASTRINNSEPFQPNFNNDNGHGHKHDTQNREADGVSSPAPESSLFHPGITLPRRAEVPDSGLIYAKPQKAIVGLRPDNPPSVTNITEQSYTNPIFDSKGKEDTTRPFQDHPKTFTKPMAKVQPTINVPKKPAPYRPNSDRTSNTHDNQITSPSQDHTEPSPVHLNDCAPAAIQRDNHDGGKAMQEVKSNVPKKPAPYRPESDCTSNTHDNPITSPSQDYTEPPSGHPQDGRQETSSPPSDVTYAQVSVPIRQNSSSSQRPGDDITYADLDLTSQTTQDDEVASTSSAVGPIIYATVSKTN